MQIRQYIDDQTELKLLERENCSCKATNVVKKAFLEERLSKNKAEVEGKIAAKKSENAARRNAVRQDINKVKGLSAKINAEEIVID